MIPGVRDFSQARIEAAAAAAALLAAPATASSGVGGTGSLQLLGKALLTPDQLREQLLVGGADDSQ